MLTAAFAVTVHAEERGEAARGGLEAKLDYCKTCHGLSGQGYRGYFPMPRLAGQQPQYLENQLRAFIERRRTNPIMANVAHVLSPAMVSALAVHFKNLDPKPFGGAPRGSLAVGKRIYEDGIPEANVPACAACHGTDGKGQNEIPRLAGQLYDYTIGQLSGWARVRGQGSAIDTSAIMAPTAHNLSRSQVEAVAAYVGYLQ
ncbi:c-type cytochrome [Bradyrhizobium betae]|uniref:Cytochrome c n=1 Tax=Bradyrhizobium betae TaxID=244734 RepID=A0A5P6PC95_9BRAD|nr:c-type cytochrome [Bradyrhizobium betae]MCS3726962.1 cytochrome c553 [Bradyrhizobium betae]QFI75103.1 cytochrome c [Bradyrhizobium betae]